MGPDDGAVENTMGEHLRIVPDLAIANDAIGAHTHATPELHIPFENHVDIEEYVDPVCDRSPDIEPSGISDGDSGNHEVVCTTATIGRLHFRQLHLVVHAEHFNVIRCNERIDGGFVLDRQRYNVGQVVLALRV